METKLAVAVQGQANLFSGGPSQGEPSLGRGIERQFDVAFVSGLALREKQVQQNYRPIIAVHKWFARRPGTLFRALLLSEFVAGALKETFYESHDLTGIQIADPFMGGGTPLLEANRMGCSVFGYDINPMAYWVVKQEIEELDLRKYREAAAEIEQWLENEIGDFYKTECTFCGKRDTDVKYFLWVKTHQCGHCKRGFDLFPGYLLAENRRHPKNVLLCPSCGELNEAEERNAPGSCSWCRTPLRLKGPAARNRCACPDCGIENTYPHKSDGPPQHRMFAIEYHCPHCRPRHRGRFFKKADVTDLDRYREAERVLLNGKTAYIPDNQIPAGDETSRLHRWGYARYREMFNDRQLLGLELTCRAIARQEDQRLREALATNLSDLLRYQNTLCRYDTYALKSLDIFSVHGFPVGLISCESNFLGLMKENARVNIGSGGWSNIVEKFFKAKQYCEQPFEVVRQNGRKRRILITDEWIGKKRAGKRSRTVNLYCASSTRIDLPPRSLDAVFTDPPYFANVQYAELMDFCYVWLRRLVAGEIFQSQTTRHGSELTGNATMERDLGHFTEGLASVWSRMATALKPGAPLAFTYHHNRLEAYYPLSVAILDAGLVCSASLACPAEMGASIHISGTGSSIVDTVFVCRSTGRISRHTLVSTPQEIAGLVEDDLEQLANSGHKPTRGDARCIAYGHLIRLAIWHIRQTWEEERKTGEKLQRISQAVQDLGGIEQVEPYLPDNLLRLSGKRTVRVKEVESPPYEVSF